MFFSAKDQSTLPDPYPLLPPAPPTNYPSSDERFSDDDEPLPPPAILSFPEKQYFFNPEWTRQDEQDFRRFLAAGWIDLGRRSDLASYDHTVVGEMLYFKDRLVRDRELRSQPPPPSQPEPTLPPLADNEVDYFVHPEGIFFCFFPLNFFKE